MSISKIISTEDAVSVIASGDVIASSGWGGHGVAEEVLIELEKRFLDTGEPRDLTLVWAGGQGDMQGAGLDHLGHEGLLARTIGGHYGLVPKIAALAMDNKVAAYNLPEGVLLDLYRSSASGSPGVVSTVGIGTFVDPRVEGGKVNAAAGDDLVEVTHRNGEDWLLYHGISIDIAIIRGTTADALGNITTEKEAVSLEILELAMAAKASNGYVICQVERVAEPGSLDSRAVRVPGFLVDAVVVAEPGHHMQTFGTQYNPAVSGEIKVPVASLPPLDLDARTVVARRGALELTADSVVNVGLGLPEIVGRVAAEEGVQDLVTFTIDTGVIGGVPLSGLDFGASINRDALIDHGASFDFIDGGGLDAVFLGFAECDANGDVNASRFAGRITGCGGAINLTQRTQNVVFMTPFTSGGLETRIGNGHLEIVSEGRFCKFVDRVGQIMFSADVARSRDQHITYVTERCVMTLCDEGLELIEIAPGIDIERDILALLPFEPRVESPTLMASELFTDEPIGLRKRMLELHVSERLAYEAASNTVFIDFSGMHVRTPADVDEIVAEVDELLRAVGKRVNAVINYDRFQLDEAAVDAYADAVRYVEEAYYIPGGAQRHTTNAFMRLKLGRELEKRSLDPKLDLVDES